jgi:hypothetical protein
MLKERKCIVRLVKGGAEADLGGLPPIWGKKPNTKIQKPNQKLKIKSQNHISKIKNVQPSSFT